MAFLPQWDIDLLGIPSFILSLQQQKESLFIIDFEKYQFEGYRQKYYLVLLETKYCLLL